MTTTISLPTEEYNLALAYAQEQHISIDELVSSLIKQLTLRQDDEVWNMHAPDLLPYSLEELSSRIDEGEAQFERGEYISHEQLMAKLQEEFAWLN